MASRSPSAGRREWIGLAVLALPCLLCSASTAAQLLSVTRTAYADAIGVTSTICALALVAAEAEPRDFAGW